MNTPCIQKLITYFAFRRLHWLLIISSVTALGTAYIAEYGFGILPCEFCIIERGVYFSIIIAAILGLRSEMFGAHGGMLIQLIILSMGIVFTAYHVGVEYHWWAGPPSCSGGGADAATFEEFRNQLMKATTPRCDQVTWPILGVSATLWSLLLQTGLAFLATLTIYAPFK
jgi:disulfide bond formation protein DsbB